MFIEGQPYGTIVATKRGYVAGMKRFFASVALLSLSTAASAAAPIEGRWQNPKDSVIVDVAPCGNAWCGRVTWANPKAKRSAAKGGTTSLVGTRLMSGFVPDGKGGWKGRIFLPKQNIHAGGTVRLAGNNALVVKGCILQGLMCKSQTWTRIN